MRFVAGGAAAFATATVASMTSSTAGASVDNHARVHCGVERWMVKTLQDRPSLFPARTVTLRFLVTRPAPAGLPVRRLPFERHICRVVAAVILVRHEDDGDYHLVLRDPSGRTMIAETPMLACTVRATPLRRMQMQTARNAARLCARASVTGVAFSDFDHGQIGVAPNAIELDPVLRFRCLSRWRVKNGPVAR
jgi:hypothetical protein